MTHAKSEAAFQRAQKVIPGGVNSPVRAFRGVGGTPPFIACGEGSHIFDIDDAVTSMEMVRLVNSGTEATMSAIRVARGFTGRDLTVKFEGCYHGHVDSLLVKAGSGLATLGIADTQGVPKGFTDT